MKKQKKNCASSNEPEVGFLRESPHGVELFIAVRPNSSRTSVEGAMDNALKIKTTAPPVEDRANKACLKLLSKTLGIPKNSMSIISGRKSRKKTVLIENSTIDAIRRRLMELLP